MSLGSAKNRNRFSHNAASILAVLAFGFGAAMVHAGAGSNANFGAIGSNVNPGVIPAHAHPYGMTYGEWSAAWWSWVVGIPAGDNFDENPILDETGEFGDIDQQGPVFFLAGSFGATVERTLTIPQGKGLFFPIVNSLWWAPDDLESAIFILEEILGLDADDFTDEELIRFIANYHQDFDELAMTCTIDGVELSDLEQYYTDSPDFHITDTDFFDDLGVPIGEDNLAVSAGRWIMLTPRSAGEHTIRFTVVADDAVFGPFALDVTYNLTVE